MKDDTLVVGFIRGSHGLEGKVKVESTSGEVKHFFNLTEVTLRKEGTETLCKVESVEGSAASLVIKFSGINSVEAASKYRGAEIVVPRSKACPLNKDEFYVEDLKQCTLIYKSDGKDGLNTEDDSAINAGIVTDVLEGGNGDLLEVTVSESLGDSFQKSALIPFKKEFIGRIDVNKKTIELLHLWILE